MPQKSAAMGLRERKYARAKRAYLKAWPWCEACALTAVGANPPRPATDLHHKRGRAGALLSDRRFFMSACRPCHDWIHANGELARALGLMAPAAEWNTVPR